MVLFIFLFLSLSIHEDPVNGGFTVFISRMQYLGLLNQIVFGPPYLIANIALNCIIRSFILNED